MHERRRREKEKGEGEMHIVSSTELNASTNSRVSAYSPCGVLSDERESIIKNQNNKNKQQRARKDGYSSP